MSKRFKRIRCDGLFRTIFEVAMAQGWVVEPTNGDHFCFTPPDKTKPKIYTSSTPSDRRMVNNLKAQLRRAGLEI